MVGIVEAAGDERVADERMWGELLDDVHLDIVATGEQADSGALGAITPAGRGDLMRNLRTDFFGGTDFFGRNDFFGWNDFFGRTDLVVWASPTVWDSSSSDDVAPWGLYAVSGVPAAAVCVSTGEIAAALLAGPKC